MESVRKPPVKKRKLQDVVELLDDDDQEEPEFEDEEDDDEYSSSANFESPSESGDMSSDEESFIDNNNKTFQLPKMDSQETVGATPLSPTLATQPPAKIVTNVNSSPSPRTTTKTTPTTTVATKTTNKRKVSLSPPDSLARRQTKSPTPKKKTLTLTKAPPAVPAESKKKKTGKKKSTPETKTKKVVDPPKTQTTTATATSSSTSSKPTKATKATKNKPTKVLEPTKPKKKAKKKSFQDELLHYMFISCKPFTVKVLAQDLNTNEASVNFCLLSLVDKGWVIKKEFTSKKSTGRTKELYWANQEAKSKELADSLRMVSPETVQEKRRELAALQQKEKQYAMELIQVQQEPSNEELNKQLEDMEQQVQVLKQSVSESMARIQAASNNNNNKTKVPATKLGFGKQNHAVRSNKPTCPKKLKVQINKMRDEWKKRKNKCKDFLDVLADGMEKKVKDVVKLLEIETDEVAGVTMPPKYVLEPK